jgi:hypothetical protein
LSEEWGSMCSVRRVSDNSNSFFLNKFDLVEVLL